MSPFCGTMFLTQGGFFMEYILNHDLAHHKYFEEMTRIPHGSFHEEAYSNYLVNFAKEHGLRYIQDDMFNVVIYKDATSGYEGHEPVLLQAHTDMVCEKNKDTEFDFEEDPLQLYIEDGFLKAKGTTLGADDGVGVAYILAILADKEAKHSALECAFTVQEEVGLFGAMALKKEYFTANRMINLDDGGENATCTTSAGGMNVILKKERLLVPAYGSGYQIDVLGLSGGHSGGEIDKEKGNANKLLSRVLFMLHKQYGLSLSWIQGGLKDNAIPREASAAFVSNADFDTVEKCVKDMEKIFKQELEFSDALVHVELKECEVKEVLCVEESEEVLSLLFTLPNGLRHRSMNIEGLSIASSNVGVVSTSDDEIMINVSLRGAMESYVDTFAMEIDTLADVFGFESTHEARYPSWSYRAESNMRDTLQKVCQEVLGKELQMMAVHGGLECGVFKAMNEDMDIVTMGPKMQDIHTPDEALDLASFDATFNLLKAYLQAL